MLPVVSLQQTIPPEGVAVCPLSTVQYTCEGQSRMSWRESGSSVTATYSAVPPTNQINDTGRAGVFHTVLTDISGTTLTSTATIDSVNLTDDGRNISCLDINGAASEFVKVEGETNLIELVKNIFSLCLGTPLIPSNLTVTTLSRKNDELSINITWSQNNSHCVENYFVEMTAINTKHITNTTARSQNIGLTLQIGIVYSFRVRGADIITRISEWSDFLIFPSKSYNHFCYHLLRYCTVTFIGPPSTPSNLSVTLISKGANQSLTVNLTWSQDNNDYVMIYYVEVTAKNISTNKTTTSQNITVILQIGVVYSFRARGADTINRTGEWSDPFIYPSKSTQNTSCMQKIIPVYRCSIST